MRWWRRLLPIGFLRLSLIDNYTFFYHLLSALVGGLFGGLSTVFDTVLKKTFDGSDWQINWIVTGGALVNLLGVHFARMMHGKDKGPYFLFVAIFGRLVLVAVAFIVTPGPYLFVLTFVFVVSTILVPAMNSIFESNYSEKERGRLFGLNASLSTFVILVASYAVGRILDIDQNSYRWLFALAGVTGALSCYALYKIRIRGKGRPPEEVNDLKRAIGLMIPGIPFTNYIAAFNPGMIGTFVKRSFRATVRPFADTVRLLRENPQFREFEVYFFLYGVAFMIVLPVIPIYLVDGLRMNYSQITMARGVIAQVCPLLLMPYLGKLLTRYNPIMFCAVTFSVLAFYPVSLMMPSVLGAYIGFFVFGLGMAGIGVAWSLSPMWFSEGEDSGMFIGVHTTLTGIRALVAPLAGLLLMQWTRGYVAPFALSSFFFLLGSILMFWMYFRLKGTGKLEPEAA